MKTLILGDLHLKKIESKIENEYRHRVLKEVSRYIKKNKIKKVLQLGDFFDTRRALDISVIDETRAILDKYFKGVHITTIAGNHDVYFKSTNDICSTASIFKDNKNITVITEPTESEFGLLLPWINKENYNKTIEMIEASKSKYCFGHLEINGFAKVKGFNETNGLKPSIFKKFDKTISGHFHLVQGDKKSGIYYIGSMFQNDFSDVFDIKHMMVIDKTLESVMIHQEFFTKLHITEKSLKCDTEEIANQLNNNRFELILNCKKTIERENFLDKLYDKIEHSEYKTIDNAELLEEEVEIAISEDVSEMFLEFVESVDKSDKEKEALKTLYLETREGMKK